MILTEEQWYLQKNAHQMEDSYAAVYSF